MANRIAVFYSPEFVRYDLGPQHPLRQERIRLHYELSKSLGLLSAEGVIEIPFEPATEEQLLLVHTQEYLHRIRELSKEKGYTLLDTLDTPAFPGAYDASKWLVGGTLAGVDAVMSRQVAHSWNPGGGLHHARPDQASGFCIFNDVAIACRYLQTHYQIERILYLDIDVHHGDGVQYFFYNDPGVLTLSIHETGRILFPGTGFTDEIGEGKGKGYSVNLPLPPYTFDEAYLEAFEAIVPPIFEAYQPEVVVMQNGVDTHFQDELGHLMLTTRTFEAVATRVRKLVKKWAQNRLIAVGGGGYSYYSVPRCWTLILSKYAGVEVVNDIPQKWQNLFQEITGLESPTQLRDSQTPFINESDQKRIKKIVHQSIANVKRLVFPILDIPNM